jgi:hypothetical protein
MKIDELIQELEAVKEEHGNLEVMSAGHNRAPFTNIVTDEEGEMIGNKLHL